MRPKGKKLEGRDDVVLLQGKKRDDLVLLQGNSREERLKNFIDSFTEEEKAEWDTDGEEDEMGYHSMTFEEYVSHRLDMMESDVSTLDLMNLFLFL